MKERLEYLWVLGLIICIGLSCSFSTAKIVEVQMAKDVKGDTKEPINLTSTFDSSDKIVHCVVKLANAPEDTKVRARWLAVKVEGTEPNYKIAETDITSKNATYVDFTLTPGPGGLPPGDYKVDIFLNPDANKQEQPASTANFNIKSSGVAISKAFVTADTEGQKEETEFTADTEKIFCLVGLNGGVPGTKITFKWIAAKTEVAQPNYEIAQVSDTLDPGETSFVGNLSRPDNGFPTGEYRVDLYLNESKTPVKSVPFVVR
jgi:outer membrane usher protein FimD/PapC